MKNQWIWLVLMLASTTVLAMGEPGRWTQGWGQGVTEYMATVDEQNALYIGCGDAKKVFMMVTIQGKEYVPEQHIYDPDDKNAFALIVDGQRFDTPYLTESNAGEQSFYYMWDKLRSAKSIAVETADNQQLTLPTQDVASILPATKAAEFGCLMWDESEDTAPATASPPTPAPVTAALPSSAFDVSWRLEDIWVNMPAKVLQVVSHHDNITIQNAIVNRGNCRSTPHQKLPLTLGFGGTAKFIVPQNCNILELRLLTNQGEALYQFDAQS
ncbi:MAG: hypothetical protein RR721_01905 [Aeromonas sp.]|jgi:hypothetical protein|uniref:hypothetical protein n=1 Tax=Aeromonas sp. TaxID=647 RepID=UPI002FC6EE35